MTVLDHIATWYEEGSCKLTLKILWLTVGSIGTIANCIDSFGFQSSIFLTSLAQNFGTKAVLYFVRISMKISVKDHFNLYYLFQKMSISVYYLVIAPRFLSWWSSERQGAITAESHTSCWQIECSSYWAGSRGKVTSKCLL